MIGRGGWIAGTAVVGWMVTCIISREVMEDVEETGMEDIG
jgi:hypothetical protein